MRAPRKLYILISKKTLGVFLSNDIFTSFKAAKEWCARRNRQDSGYEHHEWRIETYVKGD